ncbi:MAG: hypothetical protein Kow0090_03690 [Myxococcota bacterium]
MPRINKIELEEAGEELSAIYKQIADERGGLAEIHKVLSLRPDIVRAHFEFYKTLMLSDRTSLSRKERELIAITVSLHNGAAYCAAHHGKALETHGGDPINLSYHRPISSGSGIDLREQALLEYSRKLTFEPTSVDDEDIIKLREVGFDDRQILEIVMLISYFCCANRLVLALDVELEHNYEKMCR